MQDRLHWIVDSFLILIVPTLSGLLNFVSIVNESIQDSICQGRILTVLFSTLEARRFVLCRRIAYLATFVIYPGKALISRRICSEFEGLS